METEPALGLEKVPTYIDETWIEIFNRKYAQEGEEHRFTATVNVEDWLVQTEEDPGSAYFQLEDQSGAVQRGWKRTIKGNILSAGITDVPQYDNTSTAPVLALTEARLISHTGREIDIDTKGLVLVRLDRLTGGSIEIEPYTV